MPLLLKTTKPVTASKDGRDIVLEAGTVVTFATYNDRGEDTFFTFTMADGTTGKLFSGDFEQVK